jgi:membrane glycosyltransferase
MNGQDIRRHKGLGIASFVIAITMLVCIFALFVVAGLLKESGATTSKSNMITGFAMFFCWLVNVVGIALGIAGCIDGSAKKTFPILGIVIGGAELLLSACLVIIGIKMAS